MKIIQVEITGVSPLLMNNPKQMLVQKSMRLKSKKYDVETEAEETAYRKKSGELYIPKNCVFAMLIQASKAYKIKNQSLSNVLAGTIHIFPEEIGLGTKKFEINTQRAVIQGKGVIRSRAMLSQWKASFEIEFDEEWLPNAPELLEEVVRGAGKRVGLLDYRPQKKGWYGTFNLTKWQVKT